MDLNVLSALSAATYQNAQAQVGNTHQALALSASQALGAGASPSASARIGPLASMAAFSGDPRGPSSAPTALLPSAPSPSRAEDPTSLKALLGSGVSALFPGTDSLPASAAALAPSNPEALVRYAYDQSQNPNASGHTFAATNQASLLTSGLNLLA